MTTRFRLKWWWFFCLRLLLLLTLFSCSNHRNIFVNNQLEYYTVFGWNCHYFAYNISCLPCTLPPFYWRCMFFCYICSTIKSLQSPPKQATVFSSRYHCTVPGSIDHRQITISNIIKMVLQSWFSQSVILPIQNCSLKVLLPWVVA